MTNQPAVLPIPGHGLEVRVTALEKVVGESLDLNLRGWRPSGLGSVFVSVESQRPSIPRGRKPKILALSTKEGGP